MENTSTPTIPVIAYHKISNDSEFGITHTTPARFKQQIEYLQENQFTPLTFSDLNVGGALPPKPVIITFDDAFESVYTYALPILKSVNFRAVVYVITDYIGLKSKWEPLKIQQRYLHLNHQQLAELRDNGFEIGSHSKTHSHLPFCSIEKIKDELYGSKKFLEQMFALDVISLCLPYGRYNRKVIEMALEAGYKYITGNCPLLPTRLKVIPRRSIYSTDRLANFSKKLHAPSKRDPGFIIEKLIQSANFASILANKIK